MGDDINVKCVTNDLYGRPSSNGMKPLTRTNENLRVAFVTRGSSESIITDHTISRSTVRNDASANFVTIKLPEKILSSDTSPVDIPMPFKLKCYPFPLTC